MKAFQCLLLVLINILKPSYGWVSNFPPSRINPVVLSRPRRCPLFLAQDLIDLDLDRDIDIDNVLLEAESALLMAEESLSKPPPQNYRQAVMNASASGIGGASLGIISGYILLYEIPDLDLLVSPQVPPILLGFIFGSIAFANGLADTRVGKVIGYPVKAITESVTLSIKRQIERKVNAIQSIPGKVAISVTKKAEATVDEIVSTPSRVAEAMNDSFQEMKTTAASKESLVLLSMLLLGALGALFIDPSIFIMPTL